MLCGILSTEEISLPLAAQCLKHPHFRTIISNSGHCWMSQWGRWPSPQLRATLPESTKRALIQETHSLGAHRLSANHVQVVRDYFPKQSCQHWNVRNKEELDTEETGWMEGRSTDPEPRDTTLRKGRDGTVLTGKGGWGQRKGTLFSVFILHACVHAVFVVCTCTYAFFLHVREHTGRGVCMLRPKADMEDHAGLFCHLSCWGRLSRSSPETTGTPHFCS